MYRGWWNTSQHNKRWQERYRGWLNASQHSKWLQERNRHFENVSQDNVRQLGEERKKMINNGLDAKHWGW
jgi:hypothetical protein